MHLVLNYFREKKGKDFWDWIWFYPLRKLLKIYSRQDSEPENRFSYTLY